MLLGPTVSVEPSRNTICARSRALVVTTSSAAMSLPICSTRSGDSGGLPTGSPSTTDVMPTRAHTGGARTTPASNERKTGQTSHVEPGHVEPGHVEPGHVESGNVERRFVM